MDDTALSYGEVKALATGDERIKEKMELDVDVTKLKSLRSSHQSEQFDMQEKQAITIPLAIKTAEERISRLEVDHDKAINNPITADDFKIVLQGVTHTDRKSAGEALKILCQKIEKPKEPKEIGEFRGFPVELSFTGSQFKVDFKGEVNHSTVIEDDPVGNMKRLDNCVEGIYDEILTQKAFIHQQHRELEVIKVEVDKPFPREEEYQTKTKKLAKLNRELGNTKSSPREKRENKEEKTSVLGELKKLKKEGEQKKSDPPPKGKGSLDQSI